MKIFIGADHRGVALKAKITAYLKDLGHDVVDVGAYTADTPCDYPPLACKVAENVASRRKARGVLLCMTGIGISIAANKVPGAYAALCYNLESARLSRQHNNANILVLGAKFVSEELMREMIRVWLAEEFEGGRHVRRLRKIKAIEKKYLNRED